MRLRKELTGDAASLLDRALASAVVAHLAHTRAAVVAAQKAEHPGVREYRERVLSAAQKRPAAVKAFRLLTRKKGKGVRPKGKLKLFEPEAVA